MAIDLNDPQIQFLLDQYLNSTDASNVKFDGHQILRPVLELEHQGRIDGFDVFASCLKLVVSTLGGSTGTAAEGLVISGGTTTGNLIRVFNQAENLIDYTTNTFVISYDGRHGIMVPIADVLDGRLDVYQGADIPCVIIKAFAGGVEDLLQIIDEDLVKVSWIDHSGQFHWQDPQANDFVFPTGNLYPEVNNLLAWTYDPVFSGGAGRLTEQTIYMQKFYLKRPQTLSSVMFHVANATAALATNSYVGLYSTAGNRLAVTADISTEFETTGMKTVNFTTPYVALPGYYYTALLAGDGPGLGPDVTTSGASAGLANANLTTSSLRFAIAGTGQTSLPATITMSGLVTAAGINPWIGVK